MNNERLLQMVQRCLTKTLPSLELDHIYCNSIFLTGHRVLGGNWFRFKYDLPGAGVSLNDQADGAPSMFLRVSFSSQLLK